MTRKNPWTELTVDLQSSQENVLFMVSWHWEISFYSSLYFCHDLCIYKDFALKESFDLCCNNFFFTSGLGDMAVSNTIGSNVFDILVGLGVPWAMQTMCVNYGSEVGLHLIKNTAFDQFIQECNLLPETEDLLASYSPFVSGDDQQSGTAVFSGTFAGLCGTHGEH